MKNSSEPKDKKNTQILQEMAQKIDQLTLALQRERADAVNIRRRAEEDKQKMANFYKASVLKDLLPFIENFDLSLQHLPEDHKESEWVKGLIATHKQLWQILSGLGFQKIESLNQQFDPRKHEAIQMDDTSQGKNEVVVEEYRSGYILGDEVIRHAVVKVGLRD